MKTASPSPVDWRSCKNTQVHFFLLHFIVYRRYATVFGLQVG